MLWYIASKHIGKWQNILSEKLLETWIVAVASAGWMGLECFWSPTSQCTAGGRTADGFISWWLWCSWSPAPDVSHYLAAHRTHFESCASPSSLAHCAYGRRSSLAGELFALLFQTILLDGGSVGAHDLHCSHILDPNCLGLPSGRRRGRVPGSLLWQCTHLYVVALPGHDGWLGLGKHGDSRVRRDLHLCRLFGGAFHGFCYYGGDECGRSLSQKRKTVRKRQLAGGTQHDATCTAGFRMFSMLAIACNCRYLHFRSTWSQRTTESTMLFVIIYRQFPHCPTANHVVGGTCLHDSLGYSTGYVLFWEGILLPLFDLCQ